MQLSKMNHVLYFNSSCIKWNETISMISDVNKMSEENLYFCMISSAIISWICANKCKTHSQTWSLSYLALRWHMTGHHKQTRHELHYPPHLSGLWSSSVWMCEMFADATTDYRPNIIIIIIITTTSLSLSAIVTQRLHLLDAQIPRKWF